MPFCPSKCHSRGLFFAFCAAAVLVGGGSPLIAAEQLPSLRYGIDLTGRLEPLVLDAVDNDAMLAEDKALAKQEQFIGALRNGVVLPLAHPGLTDPVVLEVIPGAGSLWAAAFSSRRAEGLRLHLTGVELAPGAELWIYNPDFPEFADGPSRGRGDGDRGEIWSPPFSGEVVYLEYFVPESAETMGAFLVDEMVHLYRPLNDPSGGIGTLGTGCLLDVMCYSAWNAIRNATAHIVYTSGGFGYECSATLLDTTVKDLSPYLLTANHCVETQTQANSLSITWFWQKSSCGGTKPDFDTLPKSVGADLLWETPYLDLGGADMTLLMIRGVLPSGLSWAEWTSSAIPTGTDVACISHPNGAYKRISFGDRVIHPFGDPTHYHGVEWIPGGGTILGGSSGSGLYVVSNKKFCGVASHSAQGTDCPPDGDPKGPSGFGKFDWSYPFIASYMAEGSDDSLEENDACADARLMGDGTSTGVVVKSLDADWYYFYLGTGGNVSVTLTFKDKDGNIDAKLYRTCTGPLVKSGTSTDDNEAFTYLNTGQGDYFYLNAYLADDTRNTYTMTLDVSCGLAPNPPTGCSATDGTYADHVQVSWDPNPSTISYSVWRNTVDDSGTASELGTTAAGPYDDMTASPGVTYYYWVKATNPCGTSAFSASDSGSTSGGSSYAKGDMNCDTKIDAFDIDPFVLALTDPAGYATQYPDCDFALADINDDGKVDAFDIDPFVKLLTGK